MSVAFVFTNFNNSKFTELALESIAKSDAQGSLVVIVDNASNESDKVNLKAIESKFSNAKIIYNDSNIGYFAGLNTGIEYIRNKQIAADYLVIGNNDLLFPTNFLSQIENNKSLLHRYPVLSPNIKTIDGVYQNPHVISKISKVREFVYDLYHWNYHLANLIVKVANLTHSFTDRRDEQQHAVAQEIAQGYGACYILGPVFFQHFEKLWAPTFLMYEEFFLSKQLEEKGFKYFYEPSIHVQHYCHASTGLLPGKMRWEYSRMAHKEYRKYVKVL